MAKKSLRLSVGSIFTKGPGKIYFYRYQLDGHRKTVSLQTTNRAEAVKKAETLLPIIKATSTEVIAAHVQQARGLSSPIRELSLDSVWDYYSTHPERATPATVNEQIQYHTTLDEFIRFIGNSQQTSTWSCRTLRHSPVLIPTYRRCRSSWMIRWHSVTRSSLMRS